MAVKYALDASALLCLFNQEEGQDRVRDALIEAVISAVNYSEVVAKLVERGGDVGAISRALEHLHIPVVEFDRVQAIEAGALRRSTRQAGLSLGDRSCLALAKARELIAPLVREDPAGKAAPRTAESCAPSPPGMAPATCRARPVPRDPHPSLPPESSGTQRIQPIKVPR